MIAVDTSALVAIAFDEPERDAFITRILAARRCLISAATWGETRIVIRSRCSEQANYYIEELLRSSSFEIVAVNAAVADVAARAHASFGNGSGHPAQLNFADVFSYALAKTRNVPLLFKGNDFSLTDVQSCSVS